MKIIARRRPTKWKAPSRKPFHPSGVTPGATVSTTTPDYGKTVTGQVWAQAPTRTYGRHWWVVDANGVAHECWERDLIVLGQCIDTPLPQSNAA